MKNKLVLVHVVILIAIIGTIIFVNRGRAPSQGTGLYPASSGETSGGRYCSAQGMLTNIKTIQSHRSYCLKSDSNGKTYSINTSSEYSFSIVDDQGSTLKSFATTHTKLMHVIVVRKDLANFQHIHPEFDQATGVFTLKDLTFPADGIYRIFADFAPTSASLSAGSGGQQHAMGMPLLALNQVGGAVTISEDVLVGVGIQYIPQALGSEEKAKTFDGYQISFSSDQPLIAGREVMLTFNLKRNGKPFGSAQGKPITDLQQYLGALGHSVILREGSLDFIHAHPMEDHDRPQTGEVGFMVDFPGAGRYKIFTQFQRDGKVFTTDFVVAVAQGQ